MLSTPIKTKGNPTYGKKKKGKTAKPAAMPLDPVDREKGLGTPYTGKKSGPAVDDAVEGDAGVDAGMMEEAETEATGADLIEKVRKCIQKIFKNQETDSNKIEIKDVPDVPNAHYCLLKFGTEGIDQKKEEVDK